MYNDCNCKKVVEELIDEIKWDWVKVLISLQISEFGLVEMICQRVCFNLLYTYFNFCLICVGLGRVMGVDMIMIKIECWLMRLRVFNGDRCYILWVYLDVVVYIFVDRDSRFKLICWVTKV